MKKGLSRPLLAILTAAGLGATFLVTAVSASAHPTSRTVYVAPTASKAKARSSSCDHPDYSKIQDAIAGVAVGGTVVVCKGTYPGMINVDKRITLAGRPGATVDATGDIYGIGVSASWSTVTGMKVTGASPLNPDNNQIADGIVTIAFGPNGPLAADHVRIIHNEVTGNLGSGIDINSSSYSTASFNYAHDNGVGINLADDIGLPANHNTVSFNVTNKNFGGCGIALADHTGVGVSYNTVEFNTADDNGLATATAPDASAGSGVILASPIPAGIVKGNTITGNEFSGNGHGGVVVHAHAPGTDFSGNQVTYNRIGKNNLRTDENDLQTTGIYLGSASALIITITGNLIGPDYYGVFTSGPVTVRGSANRYFGVTHKLGTAPNF
ncbi:right-handed parallel beta-helix repeat-containing protein [Jatrophihabitans sp. DSM 45814]